MSPSDPAGAGQQGGRAFFAHSTNSLVDVENAIIVDVEAITAIRRAEVLTANRTVERSIDRFDLYPTLARQIAKSWEGRASRRLRKTLRC